MKKYVLATMMLLAICSASADAQGRHRHHPSLQPNTAAVAPLDSTDQGVEAFSDTTSYDAAVADSLEEDSVQQAAAYDDESDYSPYGSSSSFDRFMRETGAFGAASIFFALILAFIILIMPFIVIIMVLRYLIKRHNDKVALMQQSINSGQPVPEQLRLIDKKSDEFMWRKGIQNAAIGLGIMVMFGVMDAEALIGIGGLVLCIGIGQMVIAKTSARKNSNLE